MKKIILLLCLCATLVIPNSCQDQEPLESTCDVSYKNDLVPIIQASCGGGYCHPASSSDFSSLFSEYENIKAVVDNGVLYEQVVDLKEMPKGFDPELSNSFLDEYRELFACWIEDGGQNN